MQRLDSGLYVNAQRAQVHIPTTTPGKYQLLPHVVMGKLNEEVHVATLPLHEDTMRMLGNMGLNTAGIEPMRYFYNAPKVEGKYPLYEHQMQSAGYLVAHKRGYNLSTMRVGKTASAVAGADYLQKVKGESAVLILSTVTNMEDVWKKEITGLLPEARVQVVHGTRAQRLERLSNYADYYIINFDGVKTMHKELMQMMKDKIFSIVVIDELSHYANHRSALWKCANSLINDRANPIEYVWGLTGTPGKDPIPVYAQTKLVTPHTINMTFTQWRNTTMSNPWGFTWIMKPEAHALIEKVMQPSIRFNKDDIFDLPKPEREFFYSPLNKEQERIITEFRNDLIAAIQEEGMARIAVADNKAIAVGKILQTCTGAVKVDEDVFRINIDNRLEDLKGIVNSTDRKLVIFCAYRETISVLTEWCEREGIGYSESHGGVTGKARAKQLSAFQDEESGVKLLIAHPRTTAFGTELSVADTMIFFGPPMSGYMAFAQAVERMSSIKQTATQLRIIYFYGSKEEKLAFMAAEDGEKDGAIINKLFEEVMNE